MSIAAAPSSYFYPHRHLLGIEGLTPAEIEGLLDLADDAVELSRQVNKKQDGLRGRTQINLFFEASTRTQSSFELAGKRLGADVMNMSVGSSSIKKGETVIDTAMTLNAMRPDILVVRHFAAGAVELLSQKVSCSVINAGDGSHEHPTQALLDALTIRRNKGRIAGLTIRHLRRCSALARGALEHHSPQRAWRAGAHYRTLDTSAPLCRTAWRRSIHIDGSGPRRCGHHHDAAVAA